MSDNKSHYAYACFKKSENGKITSFLCGSDIKDLTEKLGQEQTEKTANNSQDSSDGLDSHHFLSKAMGRITETIGSQNDLLSICSALGIAMVQVSHDDIESFIIKNGDEVTENNLTIYGFSESIFRQLKSKIDDLYTAAQSARSLPPALLLSLVANFDSVIADVVRDFLESKPETLKNTSKSLSIGDVLSSKSIDDLKELIIRDEIYLFSRGSHEEQVKFIEKYFHIEIIAHWKRWADFIEVFERRNLIAHGEKSFTARYAAICNTNGKDDTNSKLGKTISIKYSYLREAADLLLEFGILLIFTLWKKHFPSDFSSACDKINEICYTLILSKRYNAPIQVLEHVLSLKGIIISDSVKKMMVVNLASAYRHKDNKDKCKKVLSDVDWSASSDEYKICVSALLDEADNVASLIEPVVTSGKIRKIDFQEWPAFDFVRDTEVVSKKFRDIFGDEINGNNQMETVEFDKTNQPTGDHKPDNNTVH